MNVIEIIIQFCIDFFLTSLPETIFLFLFLIFTSSNKKDCVSKVVSYVLVLNVVSYIIITLANPTEVVKVLLLLFSMVIGVKIYDRSISIIKLIILSLIGIVTVLITQMIVILPMSLILKMDTVAITESLKYCIIFHVTGRSVQILLLYKIFLIKRRLLNERENFKVF